MKLNRVWKVSLIFLLLVLIVAAFFYVVMLTKPKALPDRSALIEEINEFFPGGAAREILDVIYIDKKHAFIPFISIRGDYSISIWQWKFDEWKLVNVNTNGFPILWKLGKDPSTYYIVWNLHEKDGVEELHMYLNRQRNFHSSSKSGQHYYPRVQVKHLISLQESTYGVMKLPDEWVTILKAIQPVPSVQDSLFKLNHARYQVDIKTIPYDNENKSIFPRRSVNGSQSSRGNFEFQHIFIMNESDLEVAP